MEVGKKKSIKYFPSSVH